MILNITGVPSGVATRVRVEAQPEAGAGGFGSPGGNKLWSFQQQKPVFSFNHSGNIWTYVEISWKYHGHIMEISGNIMETSWGKKISVHCLAIKKARAGIAGCFHGGLVRAHPGCMSEKQFAFGISKQQFWDECDL